MKFFLRLLSVFVPFVLLAYFQVQELGYPFELRIGLPRFAGIPLIALCYLSWSIFPFLSSTEFRDIICSRRSVLALGVLGVFSMVAVLQNAEWRGIQLDIQLWLGLWAGVSVAYVFVADKSARIVHLALSIFFFSMVLWSLRILSSSSEAIGLARIYDPVNFLYLDLAIPMCALVLYWRHELGNKAYLFVALSLAILFYATAVFVMARAHLIAISATGFVAWLVYLGDVLNNKQSRVIKLLAIAAGIGLPIIAIVFISREGADFMVISRFREDSYSWDENGRILEVLKVFFDCSTLQLLFGKGLGFVISSDMGDTLGLHIGITTLAFKFGLVLTVLVLIPLLIKVIVNMVRVVREQTRSLTNYKRAGLVPGITAYLVQSCLSGGYKDIVFIVIGYIIALWVYSGRHDRGALELRRDRSFVLPGR